MLQFPGDLGLAGHIRGLRRQAAIEEDRILDVGPFGAVRQLLPIKERFGLTGRFRCFAALHGPRRRLGKGMDTVPCRR